MIHGRFLAGTAACLVLAACTWTDRHTSDGSLPPLNPHQESVPWSVTGLSKDQRVLTILVDAGCATPDLQVAEAEHTVTVRAVMDVRGDAWFCSRDTARARQISLSKPLGGRALVEAPALRPVLGTVPACAAQKSVSADLPHVMCG